MPFLSQIRINPFRGKGQLLLSNPRAMRGAVLGGLPDRPTDQRVLWRIDTDNERRPRLLVLTATKPDWSHLVEQAGWPDADGDHAVVRDYAPLLLHIAAGREFAFRLTANPVQNTMTPKKRTARQHELPSHGERARGFRLGHRTAEHQLAWFLGRTGRWGFEVPEVNFDEPAPGLATATSDSRVHRNVRITARVRRSFTKGQSTAPVVLDAVTFEGTLRVSDPAILTDKLLTGIGPSKAYGCGLLTLAPLPGRSHG